MQAALYEGNLINVKLCLAQHANDLAHDGTTLDPSDGDVAGERRPRIETSIPLTGAIAECVPSMSMAGPTRATAAGSSARFIASHTLSMSASPRKRSVACQFSGATKRTPCWSLRGNSVSISTTLAVGQTARNSRLITSRVAGGGVFSTQTPLGSSRVSGRFSSKRATMDP